MYSEYWLTTECKLPRKSVIRLTDCPEMTIAVDVDWDLNHKPNKTNTVAVSRVIGIVNLKLFSSNLEK